ncbi:MAG: hypothetical protein ACFFE8_00095 [Candidatus Heimdallarchaeota archaeon]
MTKMSPILLYQIQMGGPWINLMDMTFFTRSWRNFLGVGFSIGGRSSRNDLPAVRSLNLV